MQFHEQLATLQVSSTAPNSPGRHHHQTCLLSHPHYAHQPQAARFHPYAGTQKQPTAKSTMSGASLLLQHSQSPQLQIAPALSTSSLSSWEAPTIAPSSESLAESLASSERAHQNPTQPNHLVSFGTLPGTPTAGSSMSFGFGLSAASLLGHTPPYNQIRDQQNRRSNSLSSSKIVPVKSHHSLSPSNRRKRRDITPETEDELDEEVFNMSKDSAKRFKIEKGAQSHESITHLGNLGCLSLADGKVKNSSTPELDLGKTLASLSKETLLSVFNALMTAQPHTKHIIESLLPAPSLDNTLLLISKLEKDILSAIPSGPMKGPHKLREEYVLGRIRQPLEEYILHVKGFITKFPYLPPSSSSSSTATTLAAPSAEEEQQEHAAPSTIFTLLFAITSSLRRLELSLPALPTSLLNATSGVSLPSRNPLYVYLLPHLINSWHVFLTKLSSEVNEKGKILSAGMVRNWFEQFDNLCSSEGVVSMELRKRNQEDEGEEEGEEKMFLASGKATEGVRQRMKKEIGWLIGLTDSSKLQKSRGGMEWEP